MSWQAYAAVSGETIGSAVGKLVLLELANHANADGTAAFCSKATMAKTAECDAKTVQRHLRKLEAAGWIRRGDQELVAHYRADRRPTVYDVAMDKTIRARWAAEHLAGERAPEEDTGPDTGPDTNSADHGQAAPQHPGSGGTGCTPVERNDGSECPPASDATGGSTGPNGGTQLCPPNTQEHPIPPNPPGAPVSQPIPPDHCDQHAVTARGCTPCRTAKRASGKAAVAELERLAAAEAAEARRAQHAARRGQELAERAAAVRDRTANRVHLADAKAAVRQKVAAARGVT